jgi:hypothetical protein
MSSPRFETAPSSVVWESTVSVADDFSVMLESTARCSVEPHRVMWTVHQVAVVHFFGLPATSSPAPAPAPALALVVTIRISLSSSSSSSSSSFLQAIIVQWVPAH